MGALLTPGLLAALVASGSALRCQECFAFATACSGPVLPCGPGEGACVSGVGHYTLGEGRTLSVAVRSCLEPSSCSQRHFSLTFRPGVAMRMNFTCCHQDGCNTGVVERNTSLIKSLAGCAAPGACCKRVGVTKYAQGVFDTLTRAVCYPAPRDKL